MRPFTSTRCVPQLATNPLSVLAGVEWLAHPKLPVLLISGLVETTELDELRQHGISAVLAKPHTNDALLQAVASLIGAPRNTPIPDLVRAPA